MPGFIIIIKINTKKLYGHWKTRAMLTIELSSSKFPISFLSNPQSHFLFISFLLYRYISFHQRLLHFLREFSLFLSILSSHPSLELLNSRTTCELFSNPHIYFYFSIPRSYLGPSILRNFPMSKSFF